jgi:hypothetical protein
MKHFFTGDFSVGKINFAGQAGKLCRVSLRNVGSKTQFISGKFCKSRCFKRIGIPERFRGKFRTWLPACILIPW